MCGLVGAVARRNVMPTLVESLRRLEHRGQASDSAGLAYLNGRHGVGVRRCAGKIAELEQRLQGVGLLSPLGIGHTRWATHGAPQVRNAHPPVSPCEVAVVHNGIIERDELLKNKLEQQGYRFRSDTDTELVAHLVHCHLKTSASLFEAVQAVIPQLSGAYAIAVIAASAPDTLIVARHNSPLVIGVGESEGEQFVASDAAALLQVTRHFIFLEQGDVAQLKCDDVAIVDAAGKTAIRPLKKIERTREDNSFSRQYMQKEIYATVRPDGIQAE